MGQYYFPIILGDLSHRKMLKKELIRAWLSPFAYNNGQKLMEHSYFMNPLLLAFEYLISPEGPFYMSRVVWAGEYADNEPDLQKNLHNIAQDNESSKMIRPDPSSTVYRYIINHTKNLYIDKNAGWSPIHPLPLLLAEGNGRGGGDYRGDDEILCGTWSRDIISVDHSYPRDFSEFFCKFADQYNPLPNTTSIRSSDDLMYGS